MGRRPLPKRPLQALSSRLLKPGNLCGISSPFGLLSPASGQVTYVLRTRSPLNPVLLRSVRLACVKHAASVHPEPGSNSPYELQDVQSEDQIVRRSSVSSTGLYDPNARVDRPPTHRPVTPSCLTTGVASYHSSVVKVPPRRFSSGARAEANSTTPLFPLSRETKNRCKRFRSHRPS